MMPHLWRPTEIQLGVHQLRDIDGVEEITERTKDTPPWCWAQLNHPHDGSIHMLPTWDIRKHWLDDQCDCEPVLDAGGRMVHNSFDGRERYEIHGAPRN